jgi:hypothetical protein
MAIKKDKKAKKEKEIQTQNEDKSATEEQVEPLSEKDIAILEEYFSNGMRGGPAWQKIHTDKETGQGPNIDSSYVKFSHWIRKDKIQAALTAKYKELEMQLEEAIARKSEIARGSLEPFIKYGEDGYPYYDFSTEQAQKNIGLIKELETTRERRLQGSGAAAEEWETEKIKIKLHDASAAQSDILKMHGKLVDKIDLTKNGKPATVVDEDEHNRAISELAHALGEIVSQASARKKSKVGTSKQ